MKLSIICKFLVTDIVLSNLVRNRLRVKGKMNGSNDRTLGNTIFQRQIRRVYVSHRNRLCSVGKIGYEPLEHSATDTK